MWSLYAPPAKGRTCSLLLDSPLAIAPLPVPEKLVNPASTRAAPVNQSERQFPCNPDWLDRNHRAIRGARNEDRRARPPRRPRSMVAIGHGQVPDVLAGIPEGPVVAAPVVHLVHRAAPVARPRPGDAEPVAPVVGPLAHVRELRACDIGEGTHIPAGCDAVGDLSQHAA